MNPNYSYITGLQRGETQYDSEFGIEAPKIVKAKYIRNRMYPGNPYIEALPPRISEEDCINKYTRAINVPSFDEMEEMTEEELIASVDLLDDFRTLLPFHITLEREFRRAVERSYSRRYVISDESIENELTVRNKPFISHQTMRIIEQSNAVPGFTLLGLSGCGKTTGINSLVQGYPQIIIHNPGTFNQSTQIVYLIVDCPTNNGFAQLYKNVGKALDKALGNFNKAYEKLLSAHTTLGELNSKMAELIELFHIGIIIFDEIELIDLKTTRESSLESLLLLANDTGVAIAVIGTQDAYNELFIKRRTARRTGVLIPASLYCTKEARFKDIVEDLSLFQWTKTPIVFTEEIIKELYKRTDGVISDLVEIYKLIQIDAILGKTITKKSVTTAVNNYYKGLQKAKSKEKNPLDETPGNLAENEIMNFNSASEVAEAARTEKVFDEITKDHKYMTYARLKEAVITEIKSTDNNYSRFEIEKAFGVIMACENLDEITLTNLL